MIAKFCLVPQPLLWSSLPSTQPSRRSVMSVPGFMFGPWPCQWAEAFYLTPLSIAIVNLKPIVPGHCLVLSKRVTPRFSDLTADEVADLWKTVHAIAPSLERHYRAESLTLAIQDGTAAGQTVPHVHVHILPRKPGDFNRNDQVYEELNKSDMNRAVAMDAEEDRKARSKEDMAVEAQQLRTLFTDSLPIPQ